ncbi:hypothetical protein BGW42_004612 [Actinomortierella wolfii]|nr:hypothetical protein BGW42_004612 [Actinomortierella wolfii]
MTSSSLVLTALLGSSLFASVHAAPAPLPTYAYGFEGFPSNNAVEAAPTPTATGGMPAFFEHFPWPTSLHSVSNPVAPEPTTTDVVVLPPSTTDDAVPTPSVTDDAVPTPSVTTENVVPTLLPSPTVDSSLPSSETPAGNVAEPFSSLPYDAPEMHFDDEFDDDDVANLPNAGGNSLGLVSRSSSGQKPYVNNWKCKPSAGKLPVVLVHATLLTANSWDFIAPKILKQGYCVFALTYGKIDRIPLVGAVDYLENSAAQVGNFVDQVLQATNSTQVNLVGHSQGGIIGRYWMKFLGGQGKVKKYIGISPIQQGTTLSGIVLFGKATGLFDPAKPAVDYFCPGCYQMVYDSDFMKKLNEGGDTIPGVIHANIATRLDEIVTPWRNSFQKGPSTNEVLQDFCLLALNEHLTIITNPITARWVLNQLDPSTAKSVNCLTVFDRF